MRTIIDIPEKDLKVLAALCDGKNISRSEAVRRAISLYLEEKNSSGKNNKDVARAMAYGIWEGVDGLEYQEDMRSEWDEKA